MDGKPSPPSPSISQLTLLPETIPHVTGECAPPISNQIPDGTAPALSRLSTQPGERSHPTMDDARHQWTAMKMKFAVASVVDLSNVKAGDKVRFTITGSGRAYTVQSMSPSP